MKAVYWFTLYLLMGIWSVIAPYALNFTTNLEAYWNALAVGALLILVSLVGMYMEWEEEAGAHFRHSSQRKTA
jgi:predicted membrane channel-forming protein YqfA (hemolysin III family)